MNEIHNFIDHLGDPAYLAHHFGGLFYVAMFLWTVIEGETFVIIAGLLAQKGYLNIYGLIVAAWIGSFVGDQIVFFLGRRYGHRILHHFPKLEPAVDRAIGWLETYAVVFILSYRFIYGVRNVSSIAVGLSHISWKKFACLNALAAFIWAVAFAGFGFLYGKLLGHMHHQTEAVAGSVRQITLSMLGLFALIVTLKLSVFGYQRYASRRRRIKKA